MIENASSLSAPNFIYAPTKVSSVILTTSPIEPMSMPIFSHSSFLPYSLNSVNIMPTAMSGTMRIKRRFRSNEKVSSAESR